MRKIMGGLALASFVLLAAGCKKASPLVGNWTLQAGSQSVEFAFKADNTFSVSTKAGPYTITSSGDYKLDGETLTLTTKDIQAPGAPAAAMAQAKASPEFAKPKTLTVKFNSDDEISLSGMGSQAGTLKRVKA